MANKEEEFLLKKAGGEGFDGPEGKNLAAGDMFRGPYPGISSEIDLTNNPGSNLAPPEEKYD